MSLWEKYLGSTYEMVDVLKESAAGSVALVYDKQARRVCIMKQRPLRSKETYQKLKAMRNPYVPCIYHLMEQGSVLVVVEEYIDGSTLEEYLEHAPSQRLTEAEAVDILQQLCGCMEIFHREGMVHRDIKPSNIMLTQNHVVRLIDFGIARMTNPAGGTDTEVLGTQGYAAPEQYGFGQTDARSDIYALGITMRQALGKSYHGYLEQVLTRCTALDPAQRYSSATLLLQDLHRRKHRYRAKKYGSILLALLLGFCGLYLGWPNHDMQEKESPTMPEPPAHQDVQEERLPSPPNPPEIVQTPSVKQEEGSTQPSAEQSVERKNEENPVPMPLPLPQQEAPREDTKPILSPEASVESDVFLHEGEWQHSFAVQEEEWRTWQEEDGSVYLPSDWAIHVEVKNPSSMNYPNARGRLRIIRPYGEPEVIDEVIEKGPVLAGETKDFIIPLSQYPLMRHTAVQFTFYLYDENGGRQPVADTIQTEINLEMTGNAVDPARAR